MRSPLTSSQQPSAEREPRRSLFRRALSLLADRPLLWALLIGFSIRLALWSLPLHQLANDEIEYVRVASDLVAGKGWQFYEHYHWLRAPLYPLFLAASLLLSGGDLHRAALPNILLSLLNILLAYAIAREVAESRRAALIAAALSALLLTFATFASLYMPETLFATLLAATLLALLRYTRRPRLSTAALAGALLGLAALTRSLALPLLALGLPWMFVQGYAHGLRATLRRHLPAAAIFAACCLLVIAPWTIRNQLAYGRFILIETGLSFNTWAFNEPRENMDTIFRELAAIPNPAERADYATAKGMQRLREDPAILLRKLESNWFALWRVKPIEDRFIQQDYYSDVSPSYFLAALIFDDALTLLIMLAAVWGLVLAPGWRARLLLGGWLLGTTLSILLTHGESRYRHALLPALLPYAAWALAQLLFVQLARRVRLSAMFQLACATLLSLVLAYTFLASYPWQWAGQRVSRGLLQLQGDTALWRGDPAEALRLYTLAIQAQPDSVDALLRLGRAYDAEGTLDAAEEAYRAAWKLRPTYVPASTLLGDLLRRRGDSAGARQAFAGAYAPAQEIVDWAWDNLSPSPRVRIDIGDGLDFGYVGGVYPAEQQQGVSVRWTNGEGRLRLVGEEHSRLLRIRLAAPRPEAAPVEVQVCVAARCQPLLVGHSWHTYTLLLPPSSTDTQLVVLRSDTFTSARDGRRLGVLLDWAALSPTIPILERL